MVAIFVLVTFILFIVIDILVLKAQGKKHPAFSSDRVYDKKSFYLPEDTYFLPNHLWAKELTSDSVKLGIDEFITKSISNLKLVPVVKEGNSVKKGDLLFQGNFSSKQINFYSPIEGTISKINKNLEGNKVTNPYEDDWGLELSASNFNEIKNSAYTKETASKWLKNEFEKFKDFLSLHLNEASPAGVTMHDGGNIVEGALSHLNTEAVKAFEKEFLSKF